MTTVQRTRTIETPAEVVWAALARFDTISAWAPQVEHSCLLSDRTEGVDTVRRVQTGRIALVETVERWDPGTMLAYRIEGLPPVVRSVTTAWELEPRGETTAVTVRSQVDAGPRPPQRLVARLIARRLATAADQMLDGLAEHVAGAPASTEVTS